MKYIAKAILYCIMWSLLTVVLIIERTLKLTLLLLLIIWHLKIEKKYFKMFEVYQIVFPIPLVGLVFTWENIKDYYMFINETSS
jgi:hypothetical protein